MILTLGNAGSRKAIGLLLTVVMAVTAALSFGWQKAEASGDAPVVLHSTWKVAPGDAVGIYGGHLNEGGAQVLAQPLGAGLPVDPANATVTLQVVKAEDQLIQAIMPAAAPADAYAVWVETAAGISEPFWFNRAEPFWLSDTTAYNGEQVRLFGRNLLNPASGTASGVSVVLIDTATSTRIDATVASADDYTVDFDVPAAAAAGEYRIEVTNGAGGAESKVTLDNDRTLTVIAKNADASALEARLGVSVYWLTEIPHAHFYSVDAFGATGDGATDDTDAIQAALDQAAADGGGIVYLPAGIYSFSSVSIPSRTILLGEGKDETNLVYNGEDAPEYPRAILPWESFTVRTYGEAQKLIYSDGSYVGVADLSITSDVIRPSTDDRRRIHGYVAPIALLGLARPSNDNYGSDPVPPDSPGYLVTNVRVDVADGMGVAALSAGIGVIEDSEFDVTHGGFETSNALSRFRGNEISNMMRPGSLAGGRVWFENNSLTGIDYETYVPTVGFRWNEAGGAIEHRYADFSTTENYVANNHTAGVYGSATGNEGEGLLWQGQARLKYGSVTSAGAQSLTDANGAYTSAYIGQQVTIVGGAGLGQQRIVTAFTATGLTLDRPWDIMPDSTSAYTVDAAAVTHNIVVGNTLEGQTNKGGIMFYTKDYDNIIADNTLTHSGGIWLAANQQNNGNRADYSYFDTVTNNTLSGSSKPGHGQGNTLAIGPGTDGGLVAKPDPALPSVGIFGNEIRGNDLTSIGTDIPYTGTFQENYVTRSGIVVSTPGDIGYPMAQGMIVAGNRVRDAYAGVHMADSSYNTLLADNDFAGNGIAYDDNGSVGTVLLSGGQQIPYLPFGKADQKLDGTTTIAWAAVPTAQSYTVARAVYEEGPYTDLATVTGLVYDDSGADAQPYYYRLTATNAAGEDGPPYIAQAQFNLGLKGAYNTPGRAFEVAVRDGIAYVADRDSVQLLDVSDPSDIQPVSQVTLGANIMNLALDGNRLYATSSGVLHAVDVSDPSAPAAIGSVSAPNAADLAVADGLAYVARGTNGLTVYDVSDPAAITQVKALSGLGNVSAVAVSGDYAYVSSTTGLYIVDISVPASAAVVGSYTSVVSARSATIKDGYAYVADSTNTGTGGLLILEVTDPAAPTLVSRFDTTSAPLSVQLIGPYALLSGYRNQLVVVSVRNPEAPVQTGVVDTPNNSVYNAVVDNGAIYFSNSNEGIRIYGTE